MSLMNTIRLIYSVSNFLKMSSDLTSYLGINKGRYILLEEPDFHEVVNVVNTLKNIYVIIMYLNCKVLYKGRARSILEDGDRLLITKPDGSLLIHEREKREPVNWQPPGCTLVASIRNELLYIRSIRRNPREEIVVISPHVYVLLATACDRGKFTLWGSEDEMANIVMKNPNLIEDGFKPLHREYPTPYGNIDLLGEDKHGTIVVIEFKRSVAQLSGVSQLKRYVDFMIKHHKRVRGILVAPGITNSALRLLKEYGLEFKRLSPTLKISEKDIKSSPLFSSDI